MILTAIFIFVQGCRNCDCEDALKVSNPDITKPPERHQPVSLVVKIDKNDRIYIEGREIPLSTLDTALKNLIQNKRVTDKDLTIVVDADPYASYGMVFQLVRLAKKDSVKVTANVSGIKN